MTESTEGDLSCQQVTALLVDYMTGTLDPATARALRAHLRDCQDCAAFLRTYAETIRATRSLRHEDVPAEMIDRVQQFLQARRTNTSPP